MKKKMQVTVFKRKLYYCIFLHIIGCCGGKSVGENLSSRKLSLSLSRGLLRWATYFLRLPMILGALNRNSSAVVCVDLIDTWYLLML